DRTALDLYVSAETGVANGDTFLVDDLALFSGGPGPNLGAPSGLATSNPTSTSLTFSWTAGSGSPDGTKIERKQGAGSFLQVAPVAAAPPSYGDSTGAAGTSYPYRVRPYTA